MTFWPSLFQLTPAEAAYSADCMNCTLCKRMSRTTPFVRQISVLLPRSYVILVAFVFTFGLGVIIFKPVNNFFQLNFFFHKLFKLDGDCRTLWCFGVLQELAGHKHLGTTQRYIDVNDDMLRKAVEVF